MTILRNNFGPLDAEYWLEEISESPEVEVFEFPVDAISDGYSSSVRHRKHSVSDVDWLIASAGIPGNLIALYHLISIALDSLGNCQSVQTGISKSNKDTQLQLVAKLDVINALQVADTDQIEQIANQIIPESTKRKFYNRRHFSKKAHLFIAAEELIFADIVIDGLDFEFAFSSVFERITLNYGNAGITQLISRLTQRLNQMSPSDYSQPPMERLSRSLLVVGQASRAIAVGKHSRENQLDQKPYLKLLNGGVF